MAEFLLRPGIGFYTREEPTRRDLLLIALADNPGIEQMRLAWAFGMTPMRLRQIRKFVAEKGADALFDRPGRGRKPLSTRAKQRVEKLFDAGLSIDQAYARVKRSMSRASVGRIHKAWTTRRQTEGQHKAPSPPKQGELFSKDEEVVTRQASRPARYRRATASSAIVVPVASGRSVSPHEAMEIGGTHVQHLGA